MSKRRVKQQNVPVIGLFKLARRHKKMDEQLMSEHTLKSLYKKNIYIYIYIYNSKQTTQYEHIWILIQVCFVEQQKVDPFIS